MLSFMRPTSTSPPFDDRSGALKSTWIFLSGSTSEKEKRFFSCISPFFCSIFAHKNASINLIFSTINLIHFLHICKKVVLFLRGYEFFRLNQKKQSELSETVNDGGRSKTTVLGCSEVIFRDAEKCWTSRHCTRKTSFHPQGGGNPLPMVADNKYPNEESKSN